MGKPSTNAGQCRFLAGNINQKYLEMMNCLAGLLVCMVFLPSGHTLTTIDIVNLTEHGLHPGCVPGTYQAILISKAPTHIHAHNCAQSYPQNARKKPQNARKNPSNARKSKNLVNLYNFGSAQLNRNQLGCAAPYFLSRILARRLGGGLCWWETQPWHTTPNFLGKRSIRP